MEVVALKNLPIDVNAVECIHFHECLERDNEGATVVVARNHGRKDSTTSAPSANADKHLQGRILLLRSVSCTYCFVSSEAICATRYVLLSMSANAKFR